MKILHTADLHLKEEGDERWQALEEVIGIGKKKNIDALVISGDLFNRDTDAENLRAPIREIFSNTGFKILIGPGNHDAESFQEDLFFGEDAVLLHNEPFEMNNTIFCCLPFESLEGEGLINKLRELDKLTSRSKTNILVYHGELLDTFFRREDFGAEGDGRYMPVRLSYFKDLNFDYVLAGHFHSRFDVRSIGEGSYFVYPGSPVGITRREIGQRQVNLFETGKPPSGLFINTSHYEEKSVFLDPFSAEDPLEMVKKEVEAVHPNADVVLKISGYIDGKAIGIGEDKLTSEVKALTEGSGIEVSYGFRDIHSVLSNDLFKKFMGKLQSSGNTEEEIEKQRELAIRAFMEADI